MSKKKLITTITFLFFLITFISFISAEKVITDIDTIEGYKIVPEVKDYLRTGENYTFEIHVFNQSNGVPITSGITCYMHLYNEGGDHTFIGEENTTDNIFDYAFFVNGNNFTRRGEYQAKFQCNSSSLGGSIETYFNVNDYGEELFAPVSDSFNYTMVFMMILFILTLIGLYKTEHYIGKFALYWIAHILFIVGTFSVWQFNEGYAMAYVGLAGIWRILFYVSIFAVFPMLILSLAWIFYIHTYNEHMQRLLKKGETPEKAFALMDKNKKGWFYGT